MGYVPSIWKNDSQIMNKAKEEVLTKHETCMHISLFGNTIMRI